MSYVNKESCVKRLMKTRSLKGFAQEFLLPNMAGQKLFLYNENIPRVINISFNEKTCMYSCRMCPYSEKEVRSHYRKASEMDFETLERLVAAVPNDPYYSFDISAIGETLEFKPLAEFITYMKQQKPLVNTIISTNAVLLTTDVAERLFKSGLDSIQFSLYAQNAENHEHITGTKTFERVKKNILATTELRKNYNGKTPFLQAFMIECKENSHSSEAFVDFWSQHVDQAFLRPMYNVGRSIEGMTPMFEEPDNQKRYPCVMPWYSTAVRSNGDVLPCYMYHWSEEGWNASLGNLKESTLAEIWQTEAFTKMREAHLNLDLADYPICQRCNLWNAYTNIWRETRPDSFLYEGIKLADFFDKVEGHRGG